MSVSHEFKSIFLVREKSDFFFFFNEYKKQNIQNTYSNVFVNDYLIRYHGNTRKTLYLKIHLYLYVFIRIIYILQHCSTRTLARNQNLSCFRILYDDYRFALLVKLYSTQITANAVPNVNKTFG